MRATRLQSRGRPTKRPMGVGSVDSSGNIATVSGRVPRADVRGYPETVGLASPVLVGSTVSAPEPEPEPEPEPDGDAGEAKVKRKSKAKGK